ncbi:MAG TPA: hypothetical protein VGQ99_18460 [Tepidisphaeraceae bacterium]|jgi:heme A synthase|nr:hypothetical protein [Tepidisphaeraceae bacterium]
MEPTPNPTLDYQHNATLSTDENLPPKKSFDWFNIILQIGHRSISLALFVLLITLAAIKTKFLAPHPLARIAFILADLSTLCAVGGWYLATLKQKSPRESIGLLIFSFLLAAASLATLLHTRP